MEAAKVVCVVGAGTGVGKTFVSAGVLAAAVARGASCRGLKPVESGVDGVAEDAARLGEAAGVVVTPRYALRAPVSPHRAARLEGLTVSLDEVARWVGEHAEGLTLVETAGGLLSPLDEGGLTNLDLCARLEPVVVLVVVRDELGALHQLASVMLALRTRGLDGRTIAILDRMDEGAGELENADEVVRTGIAPEVFVVEAGGSFEGVVQHLLARVEAAQPAQGRR